MQFRNRQRKNPKPKRLYSVGWLTDELDRLSSLIVRALTPYCVLCHSVVDLECGHLLTRTWRPTRWDIDAGGNCATLCHTCNMRHEFEPKYYVSWYITEYSEEAYQELKQRAASHQKFIYTDLLELYESHKARWEALKKAA
jgi:hypothetical protein